MTLITKMPTIADIAKRQDSSGGIDKEIIELLVQDNEILWDMPYVEANDVTGNLTTRRNSLPTVGFRQINAGVLSGKSTTDQIFNTSGFIETNAEVDVELVRRNGNEQDFLMSENVSFLEAMNQKMATTVFYGNTVTTPESFDGLGQVYNKISTTTTDPGYNIISAGGSGNDNLSMWLACWGPRTGYAFYPKGMTSGFDQKYMGIQKVTDSDGKIFWAHTTNYKWHMGISIRNWRYFVRIANIDISDLATYGETSDTSPKLIKLMNRAKWRVPSLVGVQPVWYAPSTVMQTLEDMINTKSSVYLTRGEVINPITGFSASQIMVNGIPVRRCDALVTETTAIG